MSNIDSTKNCELTVSLSESAAEANKSDREPNLPCDLQEKEVVDLGKGPNADEDSETKECLEDQNTDDTEILEEEPDAKEIDEDVQPESVANDATPKPVMQSNAEEAVVTDPVVMDVSRKRASEENTDEEVLAIKKLKTDAEQVKVNEDIQCEE